MKKNYLLFLMKKKHRKVNLLLHYLVFCFLAFILSFPLNAQNSSSGRKTVTGIIVDGSTGDPIIGASVIADKDKTVGTATDYKGEFQLSLPADVNVLLVSYLGYSSQRVELKGNAHLEIVLQEDLKTLSEVVVVGYGTQKKETLTGAISVMGNKGLLETPTANISNALVGRLPGISANQASGEPGDNASTIRIRGVATLNSSGTDPLIVVDGVQSTLSTMNAIDPNEIQSISVLKDASSTAVYGVKGANGVIIITTKKGVSGTPKISVSYRYGVSQLASTMKMLGSYEYALYRNEAIQNDMDISKYSAIFTEDDLWKFKNNRDYTPDEVELMYYLDDEQKQALLNSPALYYTNHDYYKEQFDGSSPQQQFNINISGGSDRVRYFTSVGYFSQTGVFQNTDYAGSNANSEYSRYNMRSNLDVDIFKNLQMSFQFGGQIGNSQGIMGVENERHKAMMVLILCTPPFAGPGIMDDKLVETLVVSQNPLSAKGGDSYSPLAYLLTRPVLHSYSSNLNTTLNLKHTLDYLTQGLSVSGTISYNDTYSKGVRIERSIPKYSATRNPENPTEILYYGGVINQNTITDNQQRSKWNRLYLEAKVDYAHTFNEHDIAALVLYNAQRTKYPGFEQNVPEGLMGMAGRVTYMYDQRYLAEVNIGYNGSENFLKGKRFGFFPAYSLGWLVTNEKFFPKNDWLTWMKIRGSYGEVGNDRIGGARFLFQSFWGYGGGYNLGNTDGTSENPYYQGAYESRVGNPDVTWERARKSNLGVEINFFKDRLSFVGDIFQEKRDNILWTLGTVPGIVGANLPPANIGKVSNKGYELQLGWSDRIQDFSYGISANVSYSRNKVEFMDEPEYPHEWMNTTGFSLGQYKGLVTDGFYNNNAQANNRPYTTTDGNKVQAGDIRYVDIDGDGIIDANDKVPIGFSNLPRYYWGSTLNLGYKGFSISVLFTGSQEGSMPMSSFYVLNPFYMTSGAALQFQYDGRWTPEKAEQGIEPTFPRASMRTIETVSGSQNDLWLRSSHFVRLKNAEVGYEFKNLGYLNKLGVAGIRIYLSGNNLYTWSPGLINGYDPEQLDANGASEGYMYPPMRSYNMGVNIQF